MYQIDNFSVQLMSNLVHYLSCQVVRGTTGAYLNFSLAVCLKAKNLGSWYIRLWLMSQLPTYVVF